MTTGAENDEKAKHRLKNANRNPEIVSVLSDHKQNCPVYNATKDHMNGVLSIDFLVYGEQIFLRLSDDHFEAISV